MRIGALERQSYLRAGGNSMAAVLEILSITYIH